MTDEFHTDYQYDRCVSRGICSVNPATSSLQEVILIYLRAAAFYGIKLEKQGIKDKRIQNLILNTISVLSSNYEISETNFLMINSTFKIELPKIMEIYKELYPDEEYFDINHLINTNFSLNDYIRLGEKEFNKRIDKMSTAKRELYRILFVLIKSLCINILTYESFDRGADDEIQSVFEILNLLNTDAINKEELKQHISNIAQKDCCLMEKLNIAQEEFYGEPSEQKVSFSTTKGKAVLVVGSNLRELEQILDIFNKKNIDVYTHDNMILAYTFPKFREYKNLKGQFGHGMENCLLDFSTFPGPIILTRHSLYNVESLYRGRLFTTDFAYSKGVIPIKDNDFSEVIESTEESKGFKTGKICESEIVGFSVQNIMKEINNKLSSNKFKHIVVIGINGFSSEEKEYFKSFIKHSPSDVLIISFSCCKQKDNVICINAAGNITGMHRLSMDLLKKISQNVTFFYPFFDRHTLSIVINMNRYNNKIFIGKWNNTILNPNMIEDLKTEFNIYEVTTPKNDMNKILDIK